MQQRGAITTTGYQFPNSYEPFLDYTSPIPCFYYATPPPSFCRFDPMMPKMEVASPGGSSPDASSSSRPGPSTRGVYNCYVCDDNADGFHFGAIACAACGAFFRRSIADSKTYSCSTRNCPVRFDSAKRGGICRFCRFERALSVGMLPLEVQAKRQRKSDEDMCHPSYKSPRLSSATPPAPSSVPSAPQFVGTAPAPVRHQSGSFDSSSTNAKGVLDLLVLMRREMAAERQRRCPIPCDSERRLRIFKQARFADECRLMATEFSLFRQFVLTRTPFIYMVENDAQSKEFFANFLDDSRQNEPQWHMLEKNSLIRELFLTFYVFETALATVRDAGIQLERKVLTDSSVVELKNLLPFFTDEHGTWDAACMASLAEPCFTHHVQTLARSLQTAHLDEVENAALFTILCAQSIPFHKRSSAAERVRRTVLEELHAHYGTAHGETASKYGTVLLLVTQLLEALHHMREFVEAVDIMNPSSWSL